MMNGAHAVIDTATMAHSVLAAGAQPLMLMRARRAHWHARWHRRLLGVQDAVPRFRRLITAAADIYRSITTRPQEKPLARID